MNGLVGTGATSDYELEEEIKNNVEHPGHYTYGKIECIDAMQACTSTEEFRGYCKLAALKYIWRVGKKDNAKQEIAKAIWYLQKLLSTY